MNWHDHIHSSPAILSGKPVVRGTRLSVDFLLRLLAAGWTEAQLLENYPQVSREALQALFCIRGGMREGRDCPSIDQP